MRRAACDGRSVLAASRDSQRAACFGGSIAPDPLVTAVAERGAHLLSASIDASAESPPPDAFEDAEQLAQIDEQLHRVAHERTVEDSPSFPPFADGLAALMSSVQLPTPRELITGNLRALRCAIARGDEQDPDRWAAYNVILGCALRLRAEQLPLYRRAGAIIEAARAFDVAYYIFATHGRLPVSSAPRLAPSPARRQGHRLEEACASEWDGSLLISRVMAAPVGTQTHLLERAVIWLRVARATADRASWEWLASSNNLACALALLGKRTHTAAGSAMLREATCVLQEALKAHAAGYRREDSDSTLINLAETLLSLAERETPDLRLQRAECALSACAIALLNVTPPEYEWLIRLQRPAREQ